MRLPLREIFTNSSMKVLIKNAKLIHPSHPVHGRTTDILIENGIIRKIAENIQDKDCQIISKPNIHVSAGWMDCFANFCDPGQEYKETVTSGAMAAAAGGFTDVMLIPNTQPVVSNKAQVDYLVQKGKDTPVNIYPIGAITQNADEKELAEMYDMASAGAIAFSDGRKPIQSSGILQKALEYVMAIDSVIIQLPDDQSIGRYGLMNEGVVSNRLGLMGKPALSEELMIARDIELARYTRSKIHFTGISTKKSIELITQAKKDGLNVSCSATPYHLFFCDEDLADYDTNLKVNPPLRTREDRDALVQAVKDGIIDFIASHHQPQDYDHKVCEFEKASNGMETLESVFGAVSTAGILIEAFVKMQTQNIRNIFGCEDIKIEEGALACLTLFVPESKIVFNKKDIFSKSDNNGFLGKALQGEVIGIFNKGRFFSRIPQ